MSDSMTEMGKYGLFRVRVRVRVPTFRVRVRVRVRVITFRTQIQRKSHANVTLEHGYFETYVQGHYSIVIESI